MEYISTRGNAPVLDFENVLLTGLARDGGLYVPAQWPEFSSKKIASFAGASYQEVAFEILHRFTGDCFQESELRGMIAAATAGFRHRAVAPLVQCDVGCFILELFHGPTFAFKDIALQLLSHMMEKLLRRRGETCTLLAATSGDTGGAALHAFCGLSQVDVFVFFPEGRVSPIQQRQMTTLRAPNLHPVAIEGDFDACQALVKDLFNTHSLRDALRLSGVNSINWGRILAQIVYYFTAAVALGAPHRPVSFTVPTGNFGDIFAGYVARKMGLPIANLVIATNANDILVRCFETGSYAVRQAVPTLSPSMDIQISSNFERLLFELCDRSAEQVTTLMEALRKEQCFQVSSKTLSSFRKEFRAGCCSEEETIQRIKNTFAETGILVDPHTATALHVAQAHQEDGIPMIVLSTAHPAKFPAVFEKTGITPPPLPPLLAQVLHRPEHYTVLPPLQEIVEAHIRTLVKTKDS